MKPRTVKIINGFIMLRFLIIIILLTVTGYVIYNSPESGLLTGFANSMIKAANIDTPIINQDESFGIVIGYLIPSIIIFTLELIFINKQKANAFWVVISLDILVTIALRNIPVIAIIILVLALTKKTKLYLQNKIIVDKLN
jgi:hypothetical protein